MHRISSGLMFSWLFLLFCSCPVLAQDTALLLEPTKPSEQELAGGQLHLFRLSIPARQFVHVVADQRGIDVVVTLFAPDGRKLVEVDSPNGSRGPETVWFVADSAGDYKIEVRSLEKSAKPGKYEIQIFRSTNSVLLNQMTSAGLRQER
jgi:hypothetical protein